jgi:hypothetical protein
LAFQLALQSYLEGIEPIEKRIKASDPDLVVKVEKKISGISYNFTKGD